MNLRNSGGKMRCVQITRLARYEDEMHETRTVASWELRAQPGMRRNLNGGCDADRYRPLQPGSGRRRTLLVTADLLLMRARTARNILTPVRDCAIYIAGVQQQRNTANTRDATQVARSGVDFAGPYRYSTVLTAGTRLCTSTAANFYTQQRRNTKRGSCIRHCTKSHTAAPWRWKLHSPDQNS
jgi:hypothetical protein